MQLLGFISPFCSLSFCHLTACTWPGRTPGKDKDSACAPNGRTNFEEEQGGGRTLLCCQHLYKIIVIKTVWFSPRDRHTDQWNVAESPALER